MNDHQKAVVTAAVDELVGYLADVVTVRVLSKLDPRVLADTSGTVTHLDSRRPADVPPARPAPEATPAVAGRRPAPDVSNDPYAEAGPMPAYDPTDNAMVTPKQIEKMLNIRKKNHVDGVIADLSRHFVAQGGQPIVARNQLTEKEAQWVIEASYATLNPGGGTTGTYGRGRGR